MDFATRNTLLKAYKDNSLAAIHVDAQWVFSNPVFHAIGRLSENLRTLNVPNIWAAWPDYERKIGTGMTTVGKYHETNQDVDYYLSRHVGAQNDEPLLMKNAQSCFGMVENHLEDFLDDRGIKTLIITGVGGRNACADKTIKQALLKDKFDVVALTDCINNTYDDYRDHIKSITTKSPDAFERRYHQTTSDELVRTLRDAPRYE